MYFFRSSSGKTSSNIEISKRNFWLIYKNIDNRTIPQSAKTCLFLSLTQW